jgi:hypothetical protein
LTGAVGSEVMRLSVADTAITASVPIRTIGGGSYGDSTASSKNTIELSGERYSVENGNPWSIYHRVVKTSGTTSYGCIGIDVRSGTLTTNEAEMFRFYETAITASVPVIYATPSTSLESCILPHGAAPSTPTNGSMWTTTAGLYVRINGVTKTVTLT